MISDLLRTTYDNVDLLAKFRSISEEFDSGSEMEHLDNDEVLAVLHRVSADFEYVSKGNFFGLSETERDHSFALNLSTKFGLVEIIMFGESNASGAKFGGPLSRVAKQVQRANGVDPVEKVLYPRFSDLSELANIVARVFSLYGDFKAELLRQE